MNPDELEELFISHIWGIPPYLLADMPWLLPDGETSYE